MSHNVVFTDAKLDDLLALAILARSATRTTHFVLTNVHNAAGAAELVRRVMAEADRDFEYKMWCSECPESKKDVLEHEEKGLFDEQPLGAEPEKFKEFLLLRANVIILAPCAQYTSRIMKKAKRVCVGLGVGLIASDVNEEKLFLMDNVASFKPGRPGGSVAREDPFWKLVQERVPLLHGLMMQWYAEEDEIDVTGAQHMAMWISDLLEMEQAKVVQTAGATGFEKCKDGKARAFFDLDVDKVNQVMHGMLQ